MIVKAPEERFPTAPQGTFPAVCVDEIDLGMVENKFNPGKPRQMVRLVWEIDECMDDGTPYRIRKDYGASLHEKATLRKDLESWRGRRFQPLELGGFDLETIVGVGCMIAIVHNTGTQGGTFSNVAAVMKLPKGLNAPTSKGYIRIKDRTAENTPPVSQPKRQSAPAVETLPPDTSEYDRYHGLQITDDDVPF